MMGHTSLQVIGSVIATAAEAGINVFDYFQYIATG